MLEQKQRLLLEFYISANDWKLFSDLDNGFVVPGHIAITA